MRLKLALITSGLLLSSQAFAQEEPLSTETTEEAPADPTMDPNGGASTGMDGSVTATVAAPGSVEKSAIDRHYVVGKGKIHAYGEIDILHINIPATPVTPSASSTAEGLGIGAGYGLSDKVTVGGQYQLTLNEFEAKGPLTLFGEYELAHNDKMSITASANVTFDFNGIDSMGESTVDTSINAGLGARYLLAPKMAVYTGAPYGPGPVGQHLSISLTDSGPITFDIPVGFAYQATPELFAFAQTQFLSFNIANKPMGADSVVLIGTDQGGIPLTLGGLYAVNKDIDATASLIFPDLKHIGDFWGVAVGARWHN